MIVRTGSSVARLMTQLRASVARVTLRVAAHTPLVVLASIATATVAVAADGDTAPRALPTGGHASNAFIPSWDTNGDGKVPRAEYDVVRGQRFALSDENGDGALSADEYVNEYAVRLDRDIATERKASIEQTHTRFGAIDKDADRCITRAEYAASGERAFVALDHDKDGRVTKSDPQTPRAESATPRPRSVIGMPTTHGHEGMLAIYDEDDDGVVTRAQYDAHRAQAFTKTDANRDGKLDATEYVDEFADRLDRQIARQRQAQLKQGHVRFEAIDADKNGGISREEYSKMSARMFERADTNEDGVVSQDDPHKAMRKSQE